MKRTWTICTSCNDAQVAVLWDTHPCSGLPYVVAVEGRCAVTGVYHTVGTGPVVSEGGTVECQSWGCQEPATMQITAHGRGTSGPFCSEHGERVLDQMNVVTVAAIEQSGGRS